MSHDYVSLLGRQQGVNLRSFHTEGKAVEWLTSRTETDDWRQAEHTPALLERRQRDPDLP
jgi:hypothetical protein